MNSQEFLIINAVGAGAFIVWYLASRGGGRRPTQLNMKAPDTEPVVVPEEKEIVIKKENAPLQHPDVPRRRPKMVNVMFNYNGHSWDAYEVLGVPAGANMTLVAQAYQDAVARSDKNSVEFLETAYQAIIQHQK